VNVARDHGCKSTEELMTTSTSFAPTMIGAPDSTRRSGAPAVRPDREIGLLDEGGEGHV
jgi:hypothetical protein